MRRALPLLLALVLLLPGCTTQQDETTSQRAETIVKIMLSNLEEQDEADSLLWITGEDELNDYLSGYYGLDSLDWFDAAILRMEGARAFELAVLQIDSGEADRTVEALQDYLVNRRGSFTGYFPDQADMAYHGQILTKHQCVALIVCQDPQSARTAFESCFGDGVNAHSIPDSLPLSPEDYSFDGRLMYKDPGRDDMTVFDHSAILSAWESGDSSGLSPEDKAVFDAAKAVFEERITPEMSDYDKELALYAWLTGNVTYDQRHYAESGAPRTSYTPYGPLIDGTGVCLGYATTFQLFMDMAGIECITVTGAAYQSRENHAWNMVRLNGEWYCVDATWDQGPRYLSGLFRFFNVTSQYMADTDHQWDYDSVPEAAAEDGGRP